MRVNDELAGHRDLELEPELPIRGEGGVSLAHLFTIPLTSFKIRKSR